MIAKQVVFLLFAVLITRAETFVKDVQYPTRVLKTFSSRAVSDSCKEDGLDCLNCRTQAFCSSGVPMFQQSCPDINPNKPVCEKGLCIASDNKCPDPTHSKPVCTSTGMFPNPYNCSQAFYCDADLKSVELQCNNNLVFNTLDGTCRQRSDQPCSTIDCTQSTKTNTVPYKPNLAYYAVCVGSPATNILMFKCPDEQNQVYDASTKTCRFICKAAGNFPDLTDCAGYINCSGSSNKWVATQQKCINGFEFNKDTRKCTKAGTVRCKNEV